MARRGHVPPSAETIGPMAGGDAKPLSLHDWPWAPCALRRIRMPTDVHLGRIACVSLFWPQICALGTGLRTRRIKPLQALRAPLAVIIPAILVVTPLMA